MQDKIGEEYTGVISSVTNFGMFIELENTIEGLIHVSYLTDDYYHYDDRSHALIGERTANVYKIGQEVEVKVVSVNTDEHTVDFELVGAPKTKRVRKTNPHKKEFTSNKSKPNKPKFIKPKSKKKNSKK